MPEKFATVDEYLDALPAEAASILTEIRRRIHRIVPGAGETISYQIPTITVDGRYLVYFAAWKRHVGLYPVPVLDDETEAELAPYRSAKSTVRFPLSQPIPYELIERVVAQLTARRG